MLKKVVVTISLLSWISLLLAPHSFAQNKPNVVIILFDDLGWGDLGANSNESSITPNMDRIAAEGIRYTQGYANAPVCSPTRAGLLTAKYPSSLGIHGPYNSNSKLNIDRYMPPYLPDSLYTIVDAFNEAGYNTGHIGKWHLGMPGSPSPKEYGYDFFNIGNLITFYSRPENRSGSSQALIEEGFKFMNSSTDPFFLNLWLQDPHARLNPSQEQLQRVIDYTGKSDFTSRELVYFAAVFEADRQIGRLDSMMKAAGLDQNTILVICSDNGPEDPVVDEVQNAGMGKTGGLRGRKRSLYEGGVRSPFVIRWPSQINPGQVNHETQISMIDLMPSLCSMANITMKANNIDGENLSSSCFGVPVARQKPLFWEWRFQTFGPLVNISPPVSMRKGPWKLLFMPGQPRLELYNLDLDPYEQYNVADKCSVMAQKMLQEAMAWKNQQPVQPIPAVYSYADPTPSNAPNFYMGAKIENDVLHWTANTTDPINVWYTPSTLLQPYTIIKTYSEVNKAQSMSMPLAQKYGYYYLEQLSDWECLNKSRVMPYLLEDQKGGVFNVMPNPSEEIMGVFINEEQPLEGASLQIVNSIGKVVLELPVNENSFVVPIAQYARGLYFMRLVNRKGMIEMKKVVFQ